jgi:hypothetical protein
MKRTLSAPATPVIKFVVPLVGVPFLGYFTYLLWRYPATFVHNDLHRGATLADQLLFTSVAGVIVSFVLPLAVLVRRVILTDDGLRVSNYLREVTIPFGAILAVSQWRIVGGLVRITLSQDFGIGTTVSFLPSARRLAFWREDEIVDELRERAGI